MSTETEERTYDDYFNELFDDKHEEKKELTEELEVSSEEEAEQNEKTNDLDDKQDEVVEKEEYKKDDKKDDGYDSLLDAIEDPHLKKQVQHLVQSDKSQRGRVSALTKKLNKLDEYYQNAISRPEAVAQKPVEENKAPASSAQEGRNTAEQSPEEAAFKEKYPALYATVERIAEAKAARRLEEHQQEFDQKIKPIEDSYKREADRREAQRLESMAAELFDSERTGISVRDVIGSQDFAAWIRGQPQTVKDFYRNAASADEAMLVLHKFENEWQYMKGINEKLSEKETQTKDDSTDKAPNRGDELREKREAVRASSTSPKSKSAGTAAVDTNDYDSIFERYWGEDGVYRSKRRLG